MSWKYFNIFNSWKEFKICTEETERRIKRKELEHAFPSDSNALLECWKYEAVSQKLKWIWKELLKILAVEELVVLELHSNYIILTIV